MMLKRLIKQQHYTLKHSKVSSTKICWLIRDVDVMISVLPIGTMTVHHKLQATTYAIINHDTSTCEILSCEQCVLHC